MDGIQNLPQNDCCGGVFALPCVLSLMGSPFGDDMLRQAIPSGSSLHTNHLLMKIWNGVTFFMALIIFDFDGVLADTLNDLIQFGQEVCDELGVKHVVNKNDLSNLEIMSFASFGRACEVPEHLVDEFVQRCLKRFAEKKSPPAIFNGLSNIIRNLAINNTIAIITTNTSQNVNAFLVEHGLSGCIHAVYGVDSPGSKAQKISIARDHLFADTKREPVFMVGDSLSDIRAAKETTTTSIAVTWGHQSLEHLLSGDPDYIVNSPHDLIEIIEKKNGRGVF